MDKLLLHNRTRASAEQVISAHPQGLLITGKNGSGKDTLSDYIAARLLDISPDKLSSHPYVLTINPDENSISIDEIRSLQQFLKLKVPAKDSQITNRVIIIKQAARMGAEAQNSLLKTLEEPPAGTVLILTAESPDSLLSTITSRTQNLEILPVSKEAALEYFKNSGISSPKLEQMYALAQGQAGLLTALVENESHPLVAQVNLAKQILSEKPADRLLRTDELAKNKQDLRLLLEAFYRITHAAITAASTKGSAKAVSQWHQREEVVIGLLKAFDKNANSKLLLDNLFLML